MGGVWCGLTYIGGGETDWASGIASGCDWYVLVAGGTDSPDGSPAGTIRAITGLVRPVCREDPGPDSNEDLSRSWLETSDTATGWETMVG